MNLISGEVYIIVLFYALHFSLYNATIIIISTNIYIIYYLFHIMCYTVLFVVCCPAII